MKKIPHFGNKYTAFHFGAFSIVADVAAAADDVSINGNKMTVNAMWFVFFTFPILISCHSQNRIINELKSRIDTSKC